jgi:hypothetical protein
LSRQKGPAEERAARVADPRYVDHGIGFQSSIFASGPAAPPLA